MALELGELGSTAGLGPEQVTQTEILSAPVSLFEGPLIDNSMLYSREMIARPMQRLDSDGPFTFYIPGESGLYIDPDSFRLEGKVVVKKKSGTEWVSLTEADQDVTVTVEVEETANDGTKSTRNKEEKQGPAVSVINSIGTSLFESVKITLNGAQVNFINTQHTNYKAYLETLLTYGADAANTHLKASGFEMDDAGEYDIIKGNNGAMKRAGWIAVSQELAFSSPLHNDILTVDKFLPDMLPLAITLTKAPDRFLLMALNSDTEFKLVITDLKIRYKKVQLPTALSTSIEAQLAAGGRARYPLVRGEIKTFAVQRGAQSHNWDNIFLGQMPNTVCVGLIGESAYQGNITKNPYNFKPFNVSSLYFNISGIHYPTEYYRFAPEQPSQHDRIMYRLMLDALGPGKANSGHQITEEQFRSGCRLYGYDFSPENCRGFHRHDHETGTFAVNMTFSENLSENVMVVLYATFNDEFQIDKDRTLYTNISGVAA